MIGIFGSVGARNDVPEKTPVSIPMTPGLAKRARLLSIAGDETRIRIFCFLFEHGEGCVSDVAESLGISVNSTSHHLRIMKDVGLLTSERMGVNICYRLVRGEFMNDLEKVICA